MTAAGSVSRSAERKSKKSNVLDTPLRGVSAGGTPGPARAPAPPCRPASHGSWSWRRLTGQRTRPQHPEEPRAQPRRRPQRPPGEARRRRPLPPAAPRLARPAAGTGASTPAGRPPTAARGAIPTRHRRTGKWEAKPPSALPPDWLFSGSRVRADASRLSSSCGGGLLENTTTWAFAVASSPW